MCAQIWRRKFTRKAGADVSVLMTPEDLKQNLDGDFFGSWLQKDQNSLVHTLDDLLKTFFGGKRRISMSDHRLMHDGELGEGDDQREHDLAIFPVADGSGLEKQPTDSWYQPHLRLISLVTMHQKQPFTDNPNEHTLLIAGSNALTDPHGFLDVASWNGKTVRYYRRDSITDPPKGPIGWIFFGKSEDAFDDDTAYLGAFNGHVNGTCMMKEIHRPWLHWRSSFNGNFDDCLSKADNDLFKQKKYLSAGRGFPLDGPCVQQPELLEPPIMRGVSNYFTQRLRTDFLSENKKLRTTPIKVRRWMAHLLWTTTVNIGCVEPSQEVLMPESVVYNRELQTHKNDLFPDIGNFPFATRDYDEAAKTLDLVLMQEVPLGTPHSTMYPEYTIGGHNDKGDRGVGHQQTSFIITQNGEGDFKFTTLQASVEDAIGISKMQKIPTGVGPQTISLLKAYTLRALLLLDFWNPVYSWRRGVLMQYVPEKTTLIQNSGSPSFDLEEKFVAAVEGSPSAKEDGSPEQRFLKLRSQYADTKDEGNALFKDAIMKYCEEVRKRAATAEGVLDYMKLVESRRRVFRPLPLDEFGYTLPFAKNKEALKSFVEMQEDGHIADIPKRGLEFLSEYIGRLKGYNPSFPGIPNIAPLPSDGTRVEAATAGSPDTSVLPISPLQLLQRPKEQHDGQFSWEDFMVPANMALPCNYSRRLIQGLRKERGCPFAGRSVFQNRESAAAT